MEEELLAAVMDFCEEHPKLATSAGSFSRCRNVSEELCRRLAARGFEASVLRLAECNANYPAAHRGWQKIGTPFWWIHYVVRVGDAIIDCTHRQFDPDAPHPLIQRLSEVKVEWDDVTTLERGGPAVSLRLEAVS